MKVRLLEKKFKESGYHFLRCGQGSHCIYENRLTRQTISVSGKREAMLNPIN